MCVRHWCWSAEKQKLRTVVRVIAAIGPIEREKENNNLAGDISFAGEPFGQFVHNSAFNGGVGATNKPSVSWVECLSSFACI